MAQQSDRASAVWALVRRQHGVVSRAQLLGLGYSPDAIVHRLSNGRLHPVGRGVYAVGRPELPRRGAWMAAVLACGPDVALSHGSAAALWRIGDEVGRTVEVTIPGGSRRRSRHVVVHRRRSLVPSEIVVREEVPVTTPICTLIDLAAQLKRGFLERAINEADKLDLVDPATLRTALDNMGRRPGAARLRATLDRRTFALTDSELERRFLPIARRAGLALPETRTRVNGFTVDFYWRELGLVVETDGIRYHRTPAQQTRDRVRDQVHTAAGLTPLRFTRAQVTYEPGYVEATLRLVACRLSEARP